MIVLRRISRPLAALPLLSGLCLVAPQARAVDWPDVPVPDGASGEVVSNHMVYNGVTMRASRFTVNQPLTGVKAFYQKQWGKGMVDTPLQGKSVLGHMDGGYYITVQLSPQGNSTEAQIGVMQLPGKGFSVDGVGKGFSRLPNTSVAQDIVYMDTPKHARTLSMVNGYSPFQNEQFYARTLRAKGYVKEQTTRLCTAASAQCVSRYTGKTDRISLTSVREKEKTVILAVIE